MESDIDKEEINSGIEPEDLHEKLEDGWKLVDVREDDEWMYGHHSEAQHIKMGDIPDKLNLFEKNSDITHSTQPLGSEPVPRDSAELEVVALPLQAARSDAGEPAPGQGAAAWADVRLRGPASRPRGAHPRGLGRHKRGVPRIRRGRVPRLCRPDA